MSDKQKETLETIKKLNDIPNDDGSHIDGYKRLFTQAELPGVTLHTLNALEEKGFLVEDEPFGLKGAMYWKWTGKEIENK
ncbi:MAG: hypothetical protein PHG06_00025 [Parabacteroides sp.]|nr:hypothetical protein [Parabacteroides sp.]